MNADFAIELLTWGILLPAGSSAALLFVGRRFLPDRYSVGFAFVVALLTGYLVLEWAPVVPERHYQWLPWLPLLCFIPLAVSLVREVRVWRLVTFVPVSAATAYFIVPAWSRLDDVRWTYLFAVGIATWITCALLDFVASRMRPGWFLTTLALLLGGLAGVLMPFLSMKFGQMVLSACGATTGIALISLRSDKPATARGLAPLAGVVLVCGAFLGFVDPDPPLYPYLTPLAAPLLLVPFVVEPLRSISERTKGISQFILVAALLCGSAWLIHAQQAQSV